MMAQSSHFSLAKWIVVLSFAREQWSVLVLAAPLAALTAAVATLQPWPMKIFVDNVLGGQPSPDIILRALQTIALTPTPSNTLKVVALATFGLYLADRIIAGLLSWISIRGSLQTVHAISKCVFERVHLQALSFHRRFSVGEIMNRIFSDSKCARDILENIVFAPTVALLTLATVLILMTRISVSLTAFAVVALPISWVINAKLSERIRRHQSEARDNQGKIQSHIQQTFTGIGVVQAFAREEHEFRRFADLSKRHAGFEKKSMLFGSFSGLVTGLVANLTSAVILWLVARSVLFGLMSLGSALLFLTYLGSLQSQLGTLRVAGAAINKVNENVDRIVHILAEPPEITDNSGAIELTSVQGVVEFKNITLAYGSTVVARNISFLANPGEITAIVGPSGAGKTTLLNSMLRFEDPLAGAILLDGRNIRQLTLESLRSQIAVVFQEPFLIAGSIAENIRVGRPGATDQEVQEAAKLAQADAFIRKLPNQYSTRIGERGASLSGGMRQRIAIARALVRRSRILVFDEVSSALDPETERSLFHGLSTYLSHCTTFIVTHRLDTIQNAHQILVLSDGDALCGDHTTLRKQSGYYSRARSMTA